MEMITLTDASNLVCLICVFLEFNVIINVRVYAYMSYMRER